jgi:hypothetical protein
MVCHPPIPIVKKGCYTPMETTIRTPTVVLLATAQPFKAELVHPVSVAMALSGMKMPLVAAVPADSRHFTPIVRMAFYMDLAIPVPIPTVAPVVTVRLYKVVPVHPALAVMVRNGMKIHRAVAVVLRQAEVLTQKVKRYMQATVALVTAYPVQPSMAERPVPYLPLLPTLDR